MGEKTLRRYPDWMMLTSNRFYEITSKGDKWYHYYNLDWENFLFYAMILQNKDYLIEGGAPEWFTRYVEEYEITPFDYQNSDITLNFYKDGWVRNTLTFHLEDRVSESGKVYNVSSVIDPSPEFMEGKDAPGRSACPPSIWMEYQLRRIDRLRDCAEWNPVKK